MSIARPSSVRVIRPATAGTRLMQTRTFIAHARMREVLGVEQRPRPDDRDGHRVAAPAKYWTKSLFPSTACSGGR